MGLDAKNPQYADSIPEWEKLRDVYQGQRAVKEKGEAYLPPTEGMQLDGMKPNEDGYKAYQAYKMRAVFHDLYKEGVEALVGFLHQKLPTIELPAALEPLRDKATSNGESLAALLRRINEEQLVTGRIGLLADLPDTLSVDALPYIATYIAESVTNWDDQSQTESEQSKLSFVILNESGMVLGKDFQWDTQTKYRLLSLIGGIYYQGVFYDVTYVEDDMFAPVYRGKPANEIPFVFINSKDILPSPDIPPLLGLADLALTIYRSEADYRQNLYMQGQETLVTIGAGASSSIEGTGAEEALRTGSGSRIDVDMGGDAKYIGVSSLGLPEQRTAIENDMKRAETKAGQLISNRGGQESGDALATRLAAQTATLNQIALTGALGLENLLKKMATWVGANPDEVKVTPNVEFSDFSLSGKEILDLMTSRQMGAPLSLESLHALMVDRGITKKTFEEEMDAIEEENGSMVPPTGTVPGVGVVE